MWVNFHICRENPFSCGLLPQHILYFGALRRFYQEYSELRIYKSEV